jgi:hypothetical protein
MSRRRRKEERKEQCLKFINDKAVKKDSSAEKIRTPEVFEVRKPILRYVCQEESRPAFPLQNA